MKIPFTKMHGLGNDFIVVDGRNLHNVNYAKFAKKHCQRHFNIGADGVLVLEKSKRADFKMLIYNSDGSRAEMCGNGLRCLIKYIYDKGLSKKNTIKIETLAGVKTAKLFIKNNAVNSVEINMGEPVFDPRLIPVKIKESVNYPLKVKNQKFNLNCVSMGNPHCVIFLKSGTVLPPFGKLRTSRTVPNLLSNHPIFPKKTNVEFVEIVNKGHINVFVYERGAGPTLACGTGAAAAAVMSILVKNLNRILKVTLPGGDLFVRWDKKTNEVYLKGPAETVFEGIINL